jgi:hypothetical protein
VYYRTLLLTPPLIACGRQDVVSIQMGSAGVSLELAPRRKHACYDVDKTRLLGAKGNAGTDERFQGVLWQYLVNFLQSYDRKACLNTE